MNELPAAAMVTMILGGAIAAWVLARLSPAMPPIRRGIHILGWGIVAGGVLYGLAMNR